MQNVRLLIATLAAATLTMTFLPARAAEVLSQNFDAAAALPAGWANEGVSGSGSWTVHAPTNPPVPAHSASYAAVFNSFSSTSGVARLAYTGGLDLSGYSGTTVTLRFWMNHDTGFSGALDRLRPQASTDGTIWTDLGSDIPRYDGTTGWREETVDISAYAGQANVRLGFLGTSAFGNNMFMDDVSVTVEDVNQPPQNMVPGAQVMAQGATLVFSTGNGNGISVSDPDGDVTVRVDLSVFQGTLHLASTTGLAVAGNDTDWLIVEGLISAVNAAFGAGISFTPLPNSVGSRSLLLTTNDGGNTGTGGVLTDVDTVSINVEPPNAAPVAVADTYTTPENTTLVVAVPGILTNDTDSDSGTLLAINLTTPAHGWLSSYNTNGAFTYEPSTDYQGEDSFIYRAYDGNSYSDPVTVTITVTEPKRTVARNAQVLKGTVETFANVWNNGNETNCEAWESAPLKLEAWLLLCFDEVYCPQCPVYVEQAYFVLVDKSRKQLWVEGWDSTADVELFCLGGTGMLIQLGMEMLDNDPNLVLLGKRKDTNLSNATFLTKTQILSAKGAFGERDIQTTENTETGLITCDLESLGVAGTATFSKYSLKVPPNSCATCGDSCSDLTDAFFAMLEKKYPDSKYDWIDAEDRAFWDYNYQQPED